MESKKFTLFFLLLILNSYCFSQLINQAEYDFLIKKSFKQKQDQIELQKIHEDILKSNYDLALQRISRNRKKKKLISALRTYQASIEYIKSNYENSLKLCDSVINEIDKKELSGYYIRALNYKAKAISAMGETDKSLDLINKANQFVKKTNDKFQLAAILYYRGVFTAEKGNFQEAIKDLKQSKKISQKINDLLNESATLSFIGLCLSHEGNYAEAIEVLNESIVIRLEIGDKRGLANSYLNMNKVYTELNDSDKRFYYENKSLKICEEIEDLQCISGRLTNIGDIFFLKGEYKKALRYQINALKIARKIGIDYRIAEIHQHIAQVHNATKKFDLALNHIDSSISLRTKIQENEGIGNSLIIKSNILLNIKKNKDALIAADAAMKLANEYKLVHVKRDAHYILSQILEQNGTTLQALDELKKFHFLKDSLLSIEKSKLIIRNELARKYEINELKNKRIQSEKEYQLKEQKQKTRNLIWVGIIIISLLLGSSYLIYLRYKSEKRLNKIVTENQKLNAQIIGLEKKSIFSQTISSIAHELNTPLGIIFAGTKEVKTAVTNQNNILFNNNLNAECLDLVKFWLPTIKETKKLFGRDLRRLIEQIFKILKTHNFLADEQLEALSIKIAELNPDSEAESFISSVFKSNHPIEIIDLLLELKKQYLLDLAIEQAVNTTKNVVAEMNVLAENQISTIEFEIFNLYDSLVNSPTINELKEQNISYSLLIDKGKIIRFDKISFAQIVSLLIQNAIESFDQNQSMRKIEITCSQNDDYEIISFRNNGIEIQPENIHRIFDRFFTTKSRKLHRGLGLSTVKSIIEGYGGKIVVNSNKEITTFDLYIKKMT